MHAELCVKHNEDGGREMHITKLRDGIDGKGFAFTLTTVTIGLDERDKPIESACETKLEPLREAHVQGDGHGKRPPKGTMECLLWKAFLEMLPLSGGGVPKAVLVDHVARTIGDTDNMKRTRDSLRSAITKLYRDGYLEIVDGMLREPADAADGDVSDLL
jgi:hypothetical protein